MTSSLSHVQLRIVILNLDVTSSISHLSFIKGMNDLNTV